MIIKELRKKPYLSFIILLIVIIVALDMSIFFFKDVYYPADMSSSIVNSEEKKIENGETGYLIYGPYVSYSKGSYRLIMDGINEKESANISVYSGEYDTVFYSDTYVPDTQLVFELPHAVKDLEIRVFIPDDTPGVVSVERYSINRYYSKFQLLIVLLINLILISLIIKFGKSLYENIFFKRAIVILTFILFSTFELLMVDVIATHSCYVSKICQYVSSPRAFIHYILNALFFYFLNAIFLLLTNSLGISFLITGLFSAVIALVGRNYYLIRGSAFELAQLQMAKDAANVVGQFAIEISLSAVVFICITLFISILVIKLKTKLSVKVRLVSSVFVSVAFILTLLNYTTIAKVAGLPLEIFKLNEFYGDNGYIYGLFVTMPHAPRKPEGYNKESVNCIIESEETTDSVVKAPDIIFVQCESLFDLSLIEDCYWSEDPLADLYNIPDSSLTYFLSPMTGGGTCNVEYEVLTGYPYANTDGSPFISMLQNGTPSLISVLKENGYVTTAIHTNTGEFFNRNKTYSNLGFDKLYFTENLDSYTSDDYIGSWLTDGYAYKVLIEDYEKRDVDSPYFAHVVTTQNHGGYTTDYDRSGIVVTSDNFTDGDRRLQTYLNMEKLSADSILDLIGYFRNVDSNVLIVLWGDHCPGYSLFGMNIDNDEKYIRTHLTPLLIWSNYGADLDLDEITAGYRIPFIVLKEIGCDSDTFFNYANANDLPDVLNTRELIALDDSIEIDYWDDQTKELWNNLWILQYDRMFGKQYSLKQNE